MTHRHSALLLAAAWEEAVRTLWCQLEPKSAERKEPSHFQGLLIDESHKVLSMLSDSCLNLL